MEYYIISKRCYSIHNNLINLDTEQASKIEAVPTVFTLKLSNGFFFASDKIDWAAK